MDFLNIKFLTFLFFAFNSAILNAASSVPIDMQTGGFAERESFALEHNPSKIFPLEYDKKNLHAANKVRKHPSNLALMIIRDGKVLHESYNHSDENSFI